MSLLLMSALIGVGGLAAGLIGALTGLGGGIVIVPLLTLGFGVDIRYAVGSSLVAVIATSSGAAAAYVKEGFTNIRVGMLLEVATVAGALVGAHLAVLIPANVIAVLFAVLVVFTAVQSLRSPSEDITVVSDALARRLRLGSTYPAPEGIRRYGVRRVPQGLLLMAAAGILSALLGIGSGVVKVLAMDRAMRLPFKVSTTTSNFMIGVTAAASAGIYLQRGYIDPMLTFPILLGVLAGALLGARILSRAPTRRLRLVFAGAVVLLAGEMLYKGLTGGL